MSIDDKITEERERIAMRAGLFGIGLGGLGLVSAVETVRAQLVNPSSRIFPPIKPYPAILSPQQHPYLFQALSAGGDFFEGYWYSLAIYHTIDLCAPKLSHRVKLGVSLGVANAIIAAVEFGLLGDLLSNAPGFLRHIRVGNPSAWDVPAGVLGSLTYASLRPLLNYIVDRIAGPVEENKPIF